MKIRLATKEILYESTGRAYAIYLEEGLGIDPIEAVDWIAVGMPNYIHPNIGKDQKVTENLVPFNANTYTFEVINMTEAEIKERDDEALRLELRIAEEQFAADGTIWLIKRELASGKLKKEDMSEKLKKAHTRMNEIEVKLGI
jgi:hypothetical protein